MELHLDPWPVFTVNTRKPLIDPKPAYQRGPIWSINHQQLFIDSILRGYDIPKLYLRKLPDGKGYGWEVIDGQQRLRAIWDFMENLFLLSDDSDPVQSFHLAGLSFEDLHYTLKDRFMAYALSIVEVSKAEDQEVEDMFLRLQNGVPLNSAEKRNAISGTVRDFVHETADSHRLMNKSVPFENSRYSHDELVAQMLLIELRGGPTSVRHTQLKALYESSAGFRKGSPQVKKLKRVMNFLHRAFPNKAPELTKVNLLSLYTVASEAISKYALSSRAKAFGEWFVGFEERRRLDEEKSEDERDEKMVSYQIAVLQQTANLASQQERQRILTEDLVATLPDLVLLDDQRQFTYAQRAAIFRNAGGKCVNPNNEPDCEGDCRWDSFHADHIEPYSLGGRTTVENGQLLCPKCNQKKAASTASG
ncbi:MAG: DUF262 domain-containing protein [Dehalococcoidia bacterium]|nr:DUF262 domain-containing protein [Dehalococcoidia bacterium]